MAGFHKSCFCLVDWNKISGLSHDHKTSPTCAHKLIKEASSSGGGVETDVTFSTISALTLSKGTTTTVKRSWDSHCEKSSFSNWLLVCDTPDGGALTSPLPSISPITYGIVKATITGEACVCGTLMSCVTVANFSAVGSLCRSPLCVELPIREKSAKTLRTGPVLRLLTCSCGTVDADCIPGTYIRNVHHCYRFQQRPQCVQGWKREVAACVVGNLPEIRVREGWSRKSVLCSYIRAEGCDGRRDGGFLPVVSKAWRSTC